MIESSGAVEAAGDRRRERLDDLAEHERDAEVGERAEQSSGLEPRQADIAPGGQKGRGRCDGEHECVAGHGRLGLQTTRPAIRIRARTRAR
jgi:hypothetical protein